MGSPIYHEIGEVWRFHMHSGELSTFWTVAGFVIWIFVLALPVLIYLAIAELQRARQRRDEPTISLGDRLDVDEEGLDKKKDEGTDRDSEGTRKRAS